MAEALSAAAMSGRVLRKALSHSFSTSKISNLAPRVSSTQTMASCSMKSMQPMKVSSLPRGNCRGTGWAPSRWRIERIQWSKSAPTRSILFTKAMRGTRYLSAWRHTVSDCGWTPATASKMATAPSSTRSDRSTSTVKSTWPGVSMMLMRKSLLKRFQDVVVAAEVMVIPRSRSCSIQSITVLPSSTSPILWVTPV